MTLFSAPSLRVSRLITMQSRSSFLNNPITLTTTSNHTCRSILIVLILSGLSGSAALEAHTSLLTCPALDPLNTTDSLEIMLNKVQDLAVSIGHAVKQMISKRCAEIQNCECSRNMCSDSTEGFECSAHVARAPVCGGGGCSASPMDFSASAVHSTSTVNRALEKEFICGLTGLDAKLEAAWKKQQGLIWIYFGSFNGVFRSFPGHLWDCARRYDNRIRPWYRGASSGLKDVVIVLDASGSMAKSRRLDLVKKALTGDKETKGLLDMLTHNDHVSIVTFSDTATTIGTIKGLTRATIDNIASLKESVERINVQSLTNSLAGLKLGFEVLIEGKRLERTSDCKRLIVFLTDGDDSFCSGSWCEASHPTDPSIRMHGTHGECRCVEAYLETIKSYQAELVAIAGHEASIFTYSMSSDADDNIPRQIACRNSGSWGNIKDGDDPLTQMASFFSFLAQSVDEEVVYWTEPYLGFSTGAMQTTAATPIFENSEFKTLLGVVGVDVHLGLVQDKFGTSTDQLLNNLQYRSKRCSSSTPSPCQMQVKRLIRTAHNEVLDASCPANIPQQQCCYSVGARKVVLVDQPKTWEQAQQYCQDHFDQGRLVALPRDAQGRIEHAYLHVLAGIAPPDGAWIGLSQQGSLVVSPWTWTDSDEEHQTITDDKLWGYHRADVGCASIDPRGSLSNVVPVACEILKAFICEAHNCQSSNGTGVCTGGAEVFDFASLSDSAKVKRPKECQAELESFVKQCDGTDGAQTQEFCSPSSAADWEKTRAKKAWCCNLAGDHEGIPLGLLVGLIAGPFACVAVLVYTVYTHRPSCCCRHARTTRIAPKRDAPPPENPAAAAPRRPQPASSAPSMPTSLYDSPSAPSALDVLGHGHGDSEA